MHKILPKKDNPVFSNLFVHCEFRIPLFYFRVFLWSKQLVQCNAIMDLIKPMSHVFMQLCSINVQIPKKLISVACYRFLDF